MKRLALLSLVVLLNGCAIVDVYRMARWDNNEYMMVNDINTQAQLGAAKCSDRKAVTPVVNYIYAKSVELKNYSSGIERNQEAAKMSQELLAITNGLHERYASEDEVSQKYCELKFNSIESSTTVMKKALGAKPR